MSTPSPLTQSLHGSVTSQARIEIIRHLWPSVSQAAPHKDELDWNAYFTYYTRECNTALVDEGKHLCARSHQDILQTAQLLKTEATREGVKSKIRENFTQQRPSYEEDKMLDGSVNLAARLFAMINIGSSPYGVSGQLSVSWSDGFLNNAVHNHFNAPPESDTENVILGSEITARNIDRVAKIGIVWTDNLADHLRLVEREKKLCVFHHASFLRWMEHIQSPTYPKGFAKETLNTLTLLFPDTDRKTKHWLEGEFGTNPLLTRVDYGLRHVGSFKAGHTSRRLESFHFWRDRLGALKDAVDEATPPSKALLKALSDRKQGDRWLNSWVATVAIGLTLFFGLVQSIEGAVQVFKAYHPATG